MQARLRNEPRKFSPLPGVTISDCGEVELDVDEQITLCLEPGRGNDLIRKTWGFYLSNSLNANLVGKGFRMALVVSYASDPPRTYLNMVATEKMATEKKGGGPLAFLVPSATCCTSVRLSPPPAAAAGAAGARGTRGT